ncbi:hypothetical protein BDN70DRAFT_373863 [Pholiota conissans]|uniref:Uncharacterized protein n=1 Tax=Pholiota conissans TaxID=109636 RepID=A0A9P6D4B7_9AGAR|nr:hypothetical protein BDN70DRAFT_373863 [Pholiota conissans]
MFPAPPNFSAAVHPLPSYSYTPSTSFPNVPTVPQQPFLTQDPHQLSQSQADLGSPEAFKENLQVVLEQVLQVQEFARRALTCMYVGVIARLSVCGGCGSDAAILYDRQNAYQTGNSRQNTDATLTRLKQMLALVIETMRQSGVGALPVLQTIDGMPPAVPTEAELLASTAQNLSTLYQKLQRSQDSAAVAANLLSMDHPAGRVGSQR